MTDDPATPAREETLLELDIRELAAAPSHAVALRLVERGWTLAASVPHRPDDALREAATAVLAELDIIRDHRAKSGVGYLAVHSSTHEALRAALAATPAAAVREADR